MSKDVLVVATFHNAGNSELAPRTELDARNPLLRSCISFGYDFQPIYVVDKEDVNFKALDYFWSSVSNRFVKTLKSRVFYPILHNAVGDKSVGPEAKYAHLKRIIYDSYDEYRKVIFMGADMLFNKDIMDFSHRMRDNLVVTNPRDDFLALNPNECYPLAIELDAAWKQYNEGLFDKFPYNEVVMRQEYGRYNWLMMGGEECTRKLQENSVVWKADSGTIEWMTFNRDKWNNRVSLFETP